MFPAGWVVDPKTKQLRIYYGAADTVIACAIADPKELVDYVLESPKWIPDVF
ncbi:MAG: hypothetical protein ACFFDI_02820 [Promethearchaeota archaeon]